MDEILKDLGWGDGFRIPVANAENRALEMEIQKKQKEKENLRFTLDSISERLEGMKKHLENVEHQFDQNQNLIYAHNSQKAAEENLAKLARIEDSTLSNEIKKFKKQEAEIKDRMKSVQTNVDKTLQHIDKLNETIKWDKDALLAWDEEVCRGEEDNKMLEKFMKQDESKFKELDLKRMYLFSDVENKRNRLISLKNDVASMEQALDKTAEMFRRQQVDRRTLVHQWEGSVRILHQRDEDINTTLQEIVNLKDLAQGRLKDLEEQKTFFENEKKNNQETEKEIDNHNKMISNVKEKIKLIEEVLAEENDELVRMKNLLRAATASLKKERARGKGIEKDIAAKNVQMMEVHEKMKKAKDELEKLKSQMATASERVEQLEKMVKEEEKILARNTAEFRKLDELVFQVNQQISELREGEKHLVLNIRHMESCCNACKKDIAKAIMELNNQKEILYNLDFAYMEKDIVLNKMLQAKNSEDDDENDSRMYELEEIQRKLMATNAFLTKEVGRLEEDMRKTTIDIQGDTKEEQYLRNRTEEKIMVVECGQKQLKALKVRNQNKQVDENVLKLRVRQAETAIDKVGGKVFCLERQRMELELAMKERELEINTLRDVLNVRRRVLNEQAANLNSRISLAKVKVEHLKCKYEVEVLKLGKDENGEPMTVTYLKVKGAQERQELQELGDKLDSRIKKTEQEIVAMENTLKVVNATNRAYRMNLQNLDPKSPENLEKEKLEEKNVQVHAECQKKKAVLESLKVITADLQEEYEEKLRMEQEILYQWKDKDQQAGEADKDLKDQEEKLERASRQLRKLVKDIRGTRNQKFRTIEEKDIELREIMDQNEYCLQQLAELVAKTYDTGPVVVQYLEEKGLSLPMLKSPTVSLKCSSTTSLPSARSTISSKSFESSVSKSSSCVFSPSIVTLDSSRLCQNSESSEEKKPCGGSRKSQTELKKKRSQ